MSFGKLDMNPGLLTTNVWVKNFGLQPATSTHQAFLVVLPTNKETIPIWLITSKIQFVKLMRSSRVIWVLLKHKQLRLKGSLGSSDIPWMSSKEECLSVHLFMSEKRLLLLLYRSFLEFLSRRALCINLAAYNIRAIFNDNLTLGLIKPNSVSFLKMAVRPTSAAFKFANSP
ncbi:hypothetical protein RF11_10295 [Thelohanellus kitauei]|uniref:Uncharacterized protein n=1 Tax=Thelohanellus kitauei TaxID=669202 RepID=A0A0C2N185_THEKT|nr:hypothetical protein RF11_10295 [Thelohanellus kitauei]